MLIAKLKLLTNFALFGFLDHKSNGLEHTWLSNRENDHSFAVLNLAPGSYLIEVTNPDFFYEPVRVDITSKGKIRARKVNNLQPNQVNQVCVFVGDETKSSLEVSDP